jgi:iron complex outermembrane receptor protein
VKTDSPGSYMNGLYSGTNRNVVAHPTTAFTTAKFGEDYSNVDPTAENLQRGVSLTGDLDLGSFDLKSISAARNTITIGHLDTDGTNLDLTSQYLRTTNLTYTQEFIATSESEGNLSWVAGLFFMADDAARNPNYSYTSTTSFATSFADIKTIAGAPYGEVTYKFDDHWSVVGGLRYSYETKHLVNSSGTNCLDISCTVPRVDSSKTWQSVNYRATLQYTVDPTLNFYFTNSTGFKSGAYNSTSFSATPVLPENLIAYELGMKSTRGGIVFTADGFYYIDKGIQISASVNPLTGTASLQNAAGAHDYGIELTASTAFDDNWSADGGVTWLHARDSSFPAADVLVPRATSLGGGNIETAEDVTGLPVYRSPDWTLNANVNYTHPLFDGRLDAVAAVYYSSEYSFEPGYRVVQPAYATLHLQATWTSPGDRYSVTLWGDNVTNTHYYEIGSSSIIWFNDVWAPPAWFGVKFGVHTD